MMQTALSSLAPVYNESGYPQSLALLILAFGSGDQ